jgi:phage tail tube protein FII
MDFERLTGRWTMPKGFTPQFIEIHLNGSVSEVKRFSWLRGEEVKNTSALFLKFHKQKPEHNNHEIRYDSKHETKNLSK